MPRFDRLELEPSAPRPEPEEGTAGPAEEVRDENYWLKLADRERRQGLHESALRYYSRALEQNKAAIPGWLGQVQMLIALGESPEAELWARKALDLFKNNGDLLAGRAQALCRMKEFAKAQSVCDLSLQQTGESAYRWLVRGEIMLHNKEGIDRHCFDKAVFADADWLVALEIAELYMRYGKPSQALNRLRPAIEKNPGEAYLWLVQARCQLEADLPEAAKRSAERCLALAPNHADAQNFLTELKQGAGGSGVGRFFRRLFRRS